MATSELSVSAQADLFVDALEKMEAARIEAVFAGRELEEMLGQGDVLPRLGFAAYQEAGYVLEFVDYEGKRGGDFCCDPAIVPDKARDLRDLLRFALGEPS